MRHFFSSVPKCRNSSDYYPLTHMSKTLLGPITPSVNMATHFVKIKSGCIYSNSKLKPDTHHYKYYNDETQIMQATATSNPSYKNQAHELVNSIKKIDGSPGAQYAAISTLATKVSDESLLNFFPETNAYKEAHREVFDDLEKKASQMPNRVIAELIKN